MYASRARFSFSIDADCQHLLTNGDRIDHRGNLGHTPSDDERRYAEVMLEPDADQDHANNVEYNRNVTGPDSTSAEDMP